MLFWWRVRQRSGKHGQIFSVRAATRKTAKKRAKRKAYKGWNILSLTKIRPVTPDEMIRYKG